MTDKEKEIILNLLKEITYTPLSEPLRRSPEFQNASHYESLLRLTVRAWLNGSYKEYEHWGTEFDKLDGQAAGIIKVAEALGVEIPDEIKPINIRKRVFDEMVPMVHGHEYKYFSGSWTPEEAYWQAANAWWAAKTLALKKGEPWKG